MQQITLKSRNGDLQNKIVPSLYLICSAAYENLKEITVSLGTRVIFVN